MLNTFSPFQVRDTQCAVEQNGPNLLFFEDSAFFVSDGDFICKTIIDEVKDKYDFIKS